MFTFQPGNFTGRGSERVKMRMVFDSSDEQEAYRKAYVTMYASEVWSNCKLLFIRLYKELHGQQPCLLFFHTSVLKISIGPKP